MSSTVSSLARVNQSLRQHGIQPLSGSKRNPNDILDKFVAFISAAEGREHEATEAIGERKRIESELRRTKQKGNLRFRHAAAHEARALSAAASSDSQLHRLTAERDELSRTVQQLRHQVALQEKHLKKAEEVTDAMRQRLRSRMSPSVARGFAASGTVTLAAPGGSSAASEALPATAASLQNQLEAQQRTHKSLWAVFNDVYAILLSAASDYTNLRQAAVKATTSAIVQASSKHPVLAAEIEDSLSPSSADLELAIQMMQQRAEALSLASAEGPANQDEPPPISTTSWMPQWPTEQQIDQAIPQLQLKLDEVQAIVDDLGGAHGPSSLLDAVQAISKAAVLAEENQQLHGMLRQAAAALQAQQSLLQRAVGQEPAAPPAPPKHLTPSQLLGMSPEAPQGQRERFLRRRLAALEDREETLARREAAVEAGEIALLCGSPLQSSHNLSAAAASPAAAAGAGPVPGKQGGGGRVQPPAAGPLVQKHGNRTPLGAVSRNTEPVAVDAAGVKALQRQLKPWQMLGQTGGKVHEGTAPKKATAFTVSF